MAHALRWAPNALDDLDEIAEFIYRDSPQYAASFAREIRVAARSLTAFGGRGRMVPELDDPSVHEIFFKSYRLIYSLGEQEVTILAIIHGSRDLASLWRRRGV